MKTNGFHAYTYSAGLVDTHPADQNPIYVVVGYDNNAHEVFEMKVDAVTGKFLGSVYN